MSEYITNDILAYYNFKIKMFKIVRIKYVLLNS